MSDLDKSVLPTWLSGENAQKLALASDSFWLKVETWCLQASKVLDEQQLIPLIIDLLAWERDITRLIDEPFDTYSKRVIYAVANAEDAGSTQGIKNIFERLGFTYVQVNERITGYDWDIVEIELNSNEHAENQQLMNELIRQYGRTCRRYVFSASDVHDIAQGIALLDYDNEVVG